MPVRDRFRRVFGRSGDHGRGSSSSGSGEGDPNHRYYKPGEVVPQPKYRRPVAKEHKEALEAFSFAKAWRRKSDQSQYSPMGTRRNSANRSDVGAGRLSWTGRKSMQSARRGEGAAVSDKVEENSADETDVANVGLSRQHTRDGTARPVPGRDGEARPPQNQKPGQLPPGCTPNSPFTQEELTLAAKRSHLEVPQ
ncbi:hypothetical protein BDY21DRAFT_367975 [Lineolata rhizophorae]|uniref:Uncharacterized protein n=1 Tax=Lineolata rhizophorae TaxID=578093 RepID=A0A6A6PD95_9PEZI|nr:hypothetical protein BDY21DRAFT_367975 [Lineolata rhizophorae]